MGHLPESLEPETSIHDRKHRPEPNRPWWWPPGLGDFFSCAEHEVAEATCVYQGLLS